MQLQNTSEVVATCTTAAMQADVAALATSAGSSGSEDGAQESAGLNIPAHEWQLVCRSDSQLSFSVPPLPDGARAMASDIVRFVEFVPGDDGKHFLHNVALDRCNDNWILFGQGNIGDWRHGHWTWVKQEDVAITLTCAWKPESTCRVLCCQ